MDWHRILVLFTSSAGFRSDLHLMRREPRRTFLTSPRPVTVNPITVDRSSRVSHNLYWNTPDASIRTVMISCGWKGTSTICGETGNSLRFSSAPLSIHAC